MSTLPATAASSKVFRHAFERYEQPLIRYAMRIVRDRERARDIVQDTFLRMCESGVQVDDPRLASWLYTVCRNRAIDLKRRDGRVNAVELPPEVAVEPSGEHHRAVNEVFDQAAALPERKARVLELRYRQGRSYQQISDETGMSVSHVGVVLHDCIKYLRKNMSVVAAVALLIGAGAWGWASQRAPSAAPSYLSEGEMTLPVVETGELPPEGEAFYGPEEFYGPELPETIEQRRRAPKARPMPYPMRAPYAVPAPAKMPNRSQPNRSIDAYESMH